MIFLLPPVLNHKPQHCRQGQLAGKQQLKHGMMHGTLRHQMNWSNQRDLTEEEFSRGWHGLSGTCQLACPLPWPD